MLAWYQQSRYRLFHFKNQRPEFCGSTESEMLHRIHVLMEYSYNHDAASLFFVVQNMAFVREAEEPFKECFACRSNAWIFSKELRTRFQDVKVGIGLRDAPLLNGIVDDTFKVTFRFVRKLVARATLCHGLAQS